MKPSTCLKFLAFASAFALGACSAQVDNEYLGEPLMVISGSVVSSDATLDASVAPVLAWYGFGVDDESASYFQRVDVRGTFPSQFTMRLYEAPPDEAIFEAWEEEPKLAFARIFALKDGATWGTYDDEQPPSWIAGSAEHYLVLWAEQPTQADGPVARLFGHTFGAGYHLLRLDELTDEERQARVACFEAHWDAVEKEVIGTLNAQLGTDYQSLGDILDSEHLDAYYELLDAAPDDDCGTKVKMTLVTTGTDHPVSIRMSRDLNFIDWF